MRIIKEVNITTAKIGAENYKKSLATLHKLHGTISNYLTDRIGPDRHKIVDFFDDLHKYVDYYVDNYNKDFDPLGLEKTFSDFLSKTNLMIKDVLGFCNIINKIIKDSDNIK